MFGRCLTSVVVAIFGAVVVTGVAAAQDGTAPPPLDSGWEEVLDSGFQIAGSPEAGFVALGSTDFETGRTDAFYSPDGRGWEPVEIETPTGDPWMVTDVALGPAGFIAVSGMAGEDDVDPRFVAFSPDGRNWERISADALPDNNFGHTVITGPDGYVVEAVNPSACPSTDSVWFSADGRTWSPSQAPLAGCGVAAIARSDSGWHLVAGGSNVTIASSPDGENWNVLDAQQPPNGRFEVEVSLAVSGDTWALMTSPKDLPGSGPGLWVSTDGGNSWSEPTIETHGANPQGDYQPRSMTVTDTGFYGVGLIEDLTDNNQGFVLFSPDGLNWHQFIVDGCCNDIAETRGGLLGAGTGTVYSWSPQLAATGPSHVKPIVAVALALLATGGAAALTSRALSAHPARHTTN